ncbi:hypothetical protein NCS52_01537500 [Fusarium sp. LHS14.1]|nr:hypothetical protein NCS52_01537500 [Fusarium sp. LHS14.1]
MAMGHKNPNSDHKSINNLIQAHPREKLFLNPLLWTPRHLQLLDCYFTDVNNDAIGAIRFHVTPPTSPGLSDSIEHDGNDPDAPHVQEHSVEPIEVRQLAKSTHRHLKRYALATLLQYTGSAFTESADHLDFYYAGRSAHRIQCLLFSQLCESSSYGDSSLPQLAYVDYADIDVSRHNVLKPRQPPDGHSNGPVQRIFHKQLAKILPKDWSQDPYLALILISIAQAQDRFLKRHLTSLNTALLKSLIESHNYVPKLLLTCNSDRDAIHLYEAEIPAPFLRKFAEPDYYEGARLIIRRKKIPFAPYSSFKNRISDVLSTSGAVKDWEALAPVGQCRIEGCLHRGVTLLSAIIEGGRKREGSTEIDERCRTRQRTE